MSDETWEQAIPRMQDALDFLHSAAEDLANSRTIDRDVRLEAIALVQRMANDLAAFGLMQPAQHAQDVLTTLDHAGLPQPERLQQQVDALQASLASALEE